MASDWTSEVYEQPADVRGWRSIPRYFAIETDELDVFICPSRGVGFWTAAQLRQWALAIGADLIIMRQRRDDGSEHAGAPALIEQEKSYVNDFERA